jgi:hypothetical protein
MEPALPEKVLVEVKDQDEEWAEVPAREPAEIVSAPNAARKAPIPGEFPAIQRNVPDAGPPWWGIIVLKLVIPFRRKPDESHP